MADRDRKLPDTAPRGEDWRRTEAGRREERGVEERRGEERRGTAR